MLQVSDRWKSTYPDAAVGILAMEGVANPEHCEALEARKEELTAHLRKQFTDGGRAAIKALPTVQAYNAYYKGFRKTYHVQHQLESVALKGRELPRVAALVEAMFVAELDNALLTAGHDLAVVAEPVRLDVAGGDESYITMSGHETTLKEGDMYIADAAGVISSIIYGPDRRTQITPDTRRVLFTVYAPSGIPHQEVRQHLEELRDTVRLITPEAAVTALTVLT